MSALLYLVKVTVMREEHQRAFVSEYMVAAPNRRRAIKIATARAYTYGAEWVHASSKCMTGAAHCMAQRTLKVQP